MCILYGYIWRFPRMGVPQNGWFLMENPKTKKTWMIWGYPHFWKPPFIPVVPHKAVAEVPNDRKPKGEVSCCDSCMAKRIDGPKGGWGSGSWVSLSLIARLCQANPRMMGSIQPKFRGPGSGSKWSEDEVSLLRAFWVSKEKEVWSKGAPK